MSDLRMELIQGQLNDIEENVQCIKATWGKTIMTINNIKSGLKADRQKAIDEAYERGLDDAWETIREIARTTYAQRSEIFDGLQDILSIMRKFSPSEATAKIREYEQQKADKIVVGDEVKCRADDCGVVTWIYGSDAYVLWQDGSTGNYAADELVKTGRHFNFLASLLEAMKEGAK